MSYDPESETTSLPIFPVIVAVALGTPALIGIALAMRWLIGW